MSWHVRTLRKSKRRWGVKKVLIAVLASAVTLLLAIINFSEVKHSYVCQGETRRMQERFVDTAYVVLSEYRWWVKLWSDPTRDGTLETQLERANTVDYVTAVTRVGSGPLALYTFKSFEGDFKGGLKAANGEFTLQLYKDLMFVGTCTAAKFGINEGPQNGK